MDAKTRPTPRPVDADDEQTFSDESGQGLAEYALILAFVAITCIGALGVLGNAIAGSPGFNILPGAL